MKASTYIIEYEAQAKNGEVLKSGKIKVKNKTSSIQAQISLEDYLKRKVKGFNRLIVKSCKEDSISAIFGDIFGKDNPFGF
jgi:hypothetical protein